MNEDQFLSVEEAAKLFKVCKQTIYNWKRSGRIKYTKIGRRVLIHKEQDNG